MQFLPVRKLPSLVRRFNFPLCVVIAGDKRLSSIGNNLTARAGHRTIQQPAIGRIHRKNIEELGTYNTSMYLNYIFIFRHGTSGNDQNSTALDSIIGSHAKASHL
jgi:hypothetical protein